MVYASARRLRLLAWCSLGCCWQAPPQPLNSNPRRARAAVRCSSVPPAQKTDVISAGVQVVLKSLSQLPSGVLQSLPAGLQVVLGNPSLFSLSANTLDGDVRLLMIALQERLSLSEDELVRVVVACPSVLSFNYAEELEPRLSQLQARLALTDAQLRHVVLAEPLLLLAAGTARAEPQLALLEEFGLSRAQQRRVVVARPAMLGLSTEATRGALLSLRRELRLAEAELPNLVAGQPGVLWGREERLASWSEMLSTVLATTPARLVPPGAPAAPTSLRAQPEHLGSLRWPQELASGRPRAEGFQAAGWPSCGSASRSHRRSCGRSAAAALAAPVATSFTSTALATAQVPSPPNLEPSTARARSELGLLSPRQVVLGWPAALETQEVGPGLALLRTRLQLSEAEARRVLVKNPMLLGQSYEGSLRPLCDATQARLLAQYAGCPV